MIRQSEFKKRYDHDMGKFSRKHIFGSGVMDTVKSFLGKKPTKKVSFATPPVRDNPRESLRDLTRESLREAVPPTKPTTNNTNKNAGDKIVKLLSGENPSRKKNTRQSPKMTQQEINNRVLQIMSGSGRKK